MWLFRNRKCYGSHVYPALPHSALSVTGLMPVSELDLCEQLKILTYCTLIHYIENNHYMLNEWGFRTNWKSGVVRVTSGPQLFTLFLALNSLQRWMHPKTCGPRMLSWSPQLWAGLHLRPTLMATSSPTDPRMEACRYWALAHRCIGVSKVLLRQVSSLCLERLRAAIWD